MGHITIRGLTKISAAAIESLPGATPVKSGNRTVALLLPIKPANRARLLATEKRAKALARGRDPARDNAALSVYGEVDPRDYSRLPARKPKSKR